MYDKYRKVYYRVAYPASTIEESDNYLKIIRSGKKNFSIMILDKDLNVIGETLFPDYTFNPHLWFVREEGLYISTNNEMNPNYDENQLVFKRVEKYELMRVKSGWKENHFLCRNQILSTLLLSPKRKEVKSDAKLM